MPLSLSIFGIGAPSGLVTLAYVQLRTIRTVGRYATPTLPRGGVAKQVERIQIDPTELEIQVWDAVFSDMEAIQVQADLKRGIFRVPTDCPIEPAAILEGTPFPDTLLRETFGRAPVDGAGCLRSCGLVLPDRPASIIAAIQTALGRKEVGQELNCLLTAFDKETGLETIVVAPDMHDPRTGLEGIFAATRRLGVVEYLCRETPDAKFPPIITTIVKPRSGSSDPCHEVVLTRAPKVPACALRVRLQVKAWDAVIFDRLIILPAETDKFIIDTGTHFTSLVVQVFDEISGELVDQQGMRFNQQVKIGLAGQTGVDILPSPFRGAPTNADLLERPRLSMSAFSIGGGPISIDPFGVMRRNANLIDVFAGRRAWKAETLFFSPGEDSQIEVIRWIKQRIESIDVLEAFLIDPYLGTDALKRVVLRQGNESIKITIIVSPATIDPDADTTDSVGGPGKHIADLVSMADSLVGQLCGEIEIVHVERGSGTRQAFHDRYLGLVHRDGTPSVYLLSNSLSKAGGEWPFAVAEIDTPTSWNIAAYVAGLAAGNDIGAKQIKSTIIWRSSDAKKNIAATSGALVNVFDQTIWSIYLRLFEINQQGNIESRTLTDPVVDQIIPVPPAGYDKKLLAAALVNGMHERDHLLAPIARRLREHIDLEQVAAQIEETMLQRLFGRLALDHRKFSSLSEPHSLLRHASEIIARHQKGTNLIRDRINPVADAYARSLEIGRKSQGQLKMLISGIHCVLIGLYLVSADSTVSLKFRIGIARDYVNLLGRMLRSVESRRHFDATNAEIHPLGESDVREAIRLVRAIAANPELEMVTIAELLLNDPLIPPSLVV